MWCPHAGGGAYQFSAAGGGEWRPAHSLGRDDRKALLQKLRNAVGGYGLAKPGPPGPRVIEAARVPVLKFQDAATGLEVDVSIGNSDAVFKSRVLGRLLSLDPRAPALVRIVKTWARHQGILDATRGTLRSWAITLMAVAFLQRQDVLPAVSALFDPMPGQHCSGIPRVRDLHSEELQRPWLDLVDANVQRLQGDMPGAEGKTLAWLLVGFFTEMSNLLFRHGAPAPQDAAHQPLDRKPDDEEEEEKEEDGAQIPSLPVLVSLDTWHGPRDGRWRAGADSVLVPDPLTGDNTTGNICPWSCRPQHSAERQERWRQICRAFLSAAHALQDYCAFQPTAAGHEGVDECQVRAAVCLESLFGADLVDKAGLWEVIHQAAFASHRREPISAMLPVQITPKVDSNTLVVEEEEEEEQEDPPEVEVAMADSEAPRPGPEARLRMPDPSAAAACRPPGPREEDYVVILTDSDSEDLPWPPVPCPWASTNALQPEDSFEFED